MNVLIVTQEFPPTVGGAGVVAQQNAAALARSGFQVSVLTVGANSGTGSTSPYALFSVPRLGKAWVVLLTLRLFFFVTFKRPGVVLNDVGAALSFSLLPRYLQNRVDYVAYLHGGEVDSLFKSPSKSFRRLGATKRILAVYRRAGALIAVSEYMGDYFRRSLNSLKPGLGQTPIETVYAGVDTEVFKPTVSSLRESLSIPDETVLLLTVGRVIEQKGFPAMLRIFARLVAETGPDRFHWVIAGDGAYARTLLSEAVRLGVRENITCTGSVPRHDLPELYSAADVFWLLSEREAFGLVYVEAQACGTPALGWNSYGVREAIVSNVTGYLANNSSEVLDWLQSQRFKTLDSTQAIDFASQLDTKHQIRELTRNLFRSAGR